MKTNFFHYLIAFALFFTNFVQANTNVNFPPNSKDKEESYTFKFEQNSLDKKIILNSNNSSYTVEIFDTEGNTIKKLNLKKNKTSKISTSKMKPGKYFLRYVGEDEKNNSVKTIIIK